MHLMLMAKSGVVVILYRKNYQKGFLAVYNFQLVLRRVNQIQPALYILNSDTGRLMYPIFVGFVVLHFHQRNLWLMVSSFVIGVVQRYVAYNIDYPIYYPQALADPFFYFPKIVKMFVAIYPVTFVAVAIKLLKYWYANQQAQQVLTQQKLQAV